MKGVGDEHTPMPIGGYDPDDLNESLAAVATDDDLAELLSDAERARYEAGEVGLFDLLSGEEIERLLARHDDGSTGEQSLGGDDAE